MASPHDESGRPTGAPPRPDTPAPHGCGASAQQPAQHRVMAAFDRFASVVTKKAGSPIAFALAVCMVVVWAVTGPLFDYSETWQLVINTGTTIVTFLMVFVIQQSQNKDCQAVHLKLDELLKAEKNARNEMIDIEYLSEEQLQQLEAQFKQRRLDDD
jgi:low affinity Fe/Cu permease